MDGVITEFALPTIGAVPSGITAGPDGAMWFTERFGNKIGRITMDGVITEFALPTPGAVVLRIAPGPDGAMWFTETSSNRIGRITIDGVITEFPALTAGSSPRSIQWGPDGAMWFTEANSNRIGRITMDGVVTEFTVPTPSSVPFGIAAGVNGSIWFTEADASRIAYIGTGRGTLVTAAITGRAAVGSTLKCKRLNDTEWTVASTSRVWLRNGKVISGATGLSYTVRSKDSGKNISCRVAVTFKPAFNQMGARAKAVKVQ